ncbi:helix-turn-helix domain-containing protein [Billgrantia endophytica]|uniref:Crp/Fnr family transcriptional regulator n=1 Tax=Billgrantia endophytica TaxID=2033802 RepID=A0A2N7TWX8_9GAMM|nr:helix-turn-helix domain-containing protein [Halomonas endophytica]PMR72665.1 Crp/Fnr family transcriptional regulator [Halomonas endophytica]
MAFKSRMLRKASQDGVDCRTCHLGSLCLPKELSRDEVAEFNGLMCPRPTLGKQERLAVQGTPFASLFAVRSGSLKQVTTTESNERLVTAFFLPGELVGLDAIAAGAYQGTIVALESTSVCELPYSPLDDLCGRVPSLRRQLQQTLSQEIHGERFKLHRLLHRTAEVRLACFLLAISDRFRLRGYSPHTFHLAMSRADIGSYLGLTPETVGRTLLAYQRQALLAIQGREFQLLDLGRMNRLAEANGRRYRKV